MVSIGLISRRFAICVILNTLFDARKVVFVLEELGLTYKSIYLDFGKNEQKSPEHVKYNPNGRIPTIVDHKNNDFALWFVVLLSSVTVV